MKNGPIVFRFKNPEAPNTLYLDRDGILNEAVIRGTEISSPRNMKELKISSDIVALTSPNIVRNWNLVIVTNQPDISRGLIDLNFVDEINNRIIAILPINVVYVCPHQHEDACSCRKPKIGMIEQFRLDYPEININELFVGDRKSDFECAQRAQITFVLRKRDYNTDLYDLSDSAIDDLSYIENYAK
jgi:D-glycero-D-manno-heptose 1,7-bisphosphate phosphatase